MFSFLYSSSSWILNCVARFTNDVNSTLCTPYKNSIWRKKNIVLFTVAFQKTMQSNHTELDSHIYIVVKHSNSIPNSVTLESADWVKESLKILYSAERFLFFFCSENWIRHLHDVAIDTQTIQFECGEHTQQEKQLFFSNTWNIFDWLKQKAKYKINLSCWCFSILNKNQFFFSLFVCCHFEVFNNFENIFNKIYLIFDVEIIYFGLLCVFFYCDFLNGISLIFCKTSLYCKNSTELISKWFYTENEIFFLTFEAVETRFYMQNTYQYRANLTFSICICSFLSFGLSVVTAGSYSVTAFGTNNKLQR